jgi:hypothetical protein
MQRGTIIMIVGLSVQIINWILSTTVSQLHGFNPANINSIKGVTGYVTIVGWLVFFAGFGIRHLDKKKSSLNNTKKKK